NAKTAFVQVDFGNGTVVRRRVATNVDRRAGKITGLGLDRALQILGLEVQTELQTEAEAETEVTKIAAILDPVQMQTVANLRDKNYVWAVAGNTTAAFDSKTNLADITLLGGDAIYVMYV